MCRRYTEETRVPTNLAIDDKLLNRAKKAGGFRTKKETVTVALEELISRRDQRNILKAIGTFDFRKDWDYKKDRREPRR
jgi:Arc/MetJ family transcription regulator